MYSPRTPFDSLLRPPPAALRSAAARQTGARRRFFPLYIYEKMPFAALAPAPSAPVSTAVAR